MARSRAFHRDVKPENVIVSKDGNAKLLDFGLARQTILPSDPAFTSSPTGDALTERSAVRSRSACREFESPRAHHLTPLPMRPEMVLVTATT